MTVGTVVDVGDEDAAVGSVVAVLVAVEAVVNVSVAVDEALKPTVDVSIVEETVIASVDAATVLENETIVDVEVLGPLVVVVAIDVASDRASALFRRSANTRCCSLG